jgi:hypothetical protein
MVAMTEMRVAIRLRDVRFDSFSDMRKRPGDTPRDLARRGWRMSGDYKDFSDRVR